MASPFAKRLSKSLALRPSSENPPFQCARLKAKQGLPLAYCFSLSFVFNEVIRPAIIRLLRSCRPSAVVFVVRSIEIDPFKRMIDRTLAHISGKHLKGIDPFLTHPYSATSVILKTRGVAVSATRLRSVPRMIFASAAAAVPSIHSFGRIATQATTAIGEPQPETGSNDDGDFAAIASTFPCGTSSESRLKMSTANNQQPTKSATTHFLCSSHLAELSQEMNDLALGAV